jgi:hypothetical protein
MDIYLSSLVNDYFICLYLFAAQLPGSPAPAECGFGLVEEFITERMW